MQQLFEQFDLFSVYRSNQLHAAIINIWIRNSSILDLISGSYINFFEKLQLQHVAMNCHFWLHSKLHRAAHA
jgi:hypothetical protein